MTAALTAAAASLGMAMTPSPAPAQPRPNILLIVADDLGADDLFHYSMPTLASLAAGGMTFSQAYGAPVCSPARAMIQTGRYPWRYGIHSHFALDSARNQDRGMPDWLDLDAPLIARTLQLAGYRTAYFGKWHLGDGPGAPEVTAYGYDETAQLFRGRGDRKFDTSQPYWRARSTAKMVTAASRFITRTPAPWFVQIGLVVPHDPLEPTPRQLARHGSGPFWSPGDIHAATLDGSIDRPMDRLLASLPENTLTIFTNDNGHEDGGGGRCAGRGHKRSLYECGIRIPMVVHWPGHVPAGRITDRVVALVDLPPTFAALAGAAWPPGDGEAIDDVLTGADRPRALSLLWQRLDGQRATNPLHVSPAYAIREGSLKLLATDEHDVELYDLQVDPYEVDNLTEQSPAIVLRLMKELQLP